jgi:hypothetical protein
VAVQLHLRQQPQVVPVVDHRIPSARRVSAAT